MTKINADSGTVGLIMQQQDMSLPCYRVPQVKVVLAYDMDQIILRTTRAVMT